MLAYNSLVRRIDYKAFSQGDFDGDTGASTGWVNPVRVCRRHGSGRNTKCGEGCQQLVM
jgi:hypothetical protein